MGVYLLLLDDDVVADPAALVTENAAWRSGDTFTASGGRRFRILATQAAEGPARLVFDGIWTVEPLDGDSGPWSCSREPRIRGRRGPSACSTVRASHPERRARTARPVG